MSMAPPLICRRLAVAGIILSAAVLAFAAAAMPSPAVSPVDWGRFSVLTPPGPAEPSPEIFRKLVKLVYVAHRVKRGEYVQKLARDYGTTVESLQATNDNELLYPSPGMKIVVYNRTGQLYEVRKAGETLGQIIRRFHGERGRALQFKQSIVRANDLPGSALIGDYEFPRGARVLLPNVRKTFDTYHFPFKSFGWPRISSRFGMRYHPILGRKRFHDGDDIAKPYGTPVVPARDGTVVEAGWHEGYGQLITIRHSDGAITRYGHLAQIYVKPGDVVKRGKTLIGRVGSTGLSTGPHLHFEVRDARGRAVNPGAKIGRR